MAAQDIFTKSFAILSYFSAGRSKAYYDVPLAPYRPFKSDAIYDMCLEMSVKKKCKDKNVIQSDRVIEGIRSLKVKKDLNL